MAESVTITTGGRLHFGPLFYGRAVGRRFGGVGVMVDRPGCRVTVARADADAVIAADEVRSVAGKCIAAMRDAGDFAGPLRVEIHESIPRHRGLGSGTQTALAIAQGMHVLHRGKPADAATLARMTGRGARSAIGIHGFARGGFLIDAGKRDDAAIGALASRCDVPAAWRFVLIAPREASGISGHTERDAFARLPAMPPETSAELCRLALTELLPAVREADHGTFAAALFEYGRIVGEFFKPVQGGCFAHPETARLAEQLRSAGFAGVAQSSWGPTIAVVTASERDARDVTGEFADRPDLWCEIARPRNCGATVD